MESWAKSNLHYEKKVMDFPNWKRCSKSFGKRGKDSCQFLEVMLNKVNHATLVDILNDADTNNKIRRIYLHMNDHRFSTTHRVIGKVLDEFMLPRPWWVIIHEDYYSFRTYNIPNIVPKQYWHHSNLSHVILQRYNHDFEPNLKRLAMVQYPYESVCNQSLLEIGSMVNSGWGSHIGIYSSKMGDNPYTVFNIWDSLTNTVTDKVNYISNEICPIVNKRLCVFLPITNCTMPLFLTNTSGKSIRGKIWPKVDFLYYSNASSIGRPILEGDPSSGNTPIIPYHMNIVKTYNPSNHLRFQTSLFLDGQGQVYDSKGDDGKPNSPYVRNVLPAFGLLLRPNSFFRFLIHRRIEEFDTESNYSFRSTFHLRQDIDNRQDSDVKKQCIAIHIRRGDRTLGLNMTEYCSRFVFPRSWIT
jgi:hypothetical protein